MSAIRQGVCRWFHFDFCGWIANHAPAGLVYGCVLRAYGDECMARKQPFFDAGELLNSSGRWAEDVCKGQPSRRPPSPGGERVTPEREKTG